jgi:acetyl-CoA carboxylase carboxyl transferase subunit alpha
MTEAGLGFEEEIFEIEQEICLIERQTVRTEDTESRLRNLQVARIDKLRSLYASLTPWQTVQVARHKNRPYTRDYLSLVFDDFVELHGDKFFGDDLAIVTGLAKLDRFKVMVVGHQKGRTYRERTACHFGCPHPEGYRKAMRKMAIAEKYKLPIICLIDTPGAFPGKEAEERGQAQVIAESMFLMSQLRTSILCVIIGEGGSGGALGIGVGDRVAMLENSYYSVISPEGCAGILWKGHEHAPAAAESLKFRAKDLLAFGVVDHVIGEPLGGAHRDHHQMANKLKSYLVHEISLLETMPLVDLVSRRYKKYREIGTFLDASSK